jgi:hypothetical protein
MSEMKYSARFQPIYTAPVNWKAIIAGQRCRGSWRMALMAATANSVAYVVNEKA